MADVLYLTHRIPYPPDKGDKITTYHFLKHLCREHRVCLGSFVDDSADWQYADAVRKMCTDVCLRPLRPWSRRTRALRALLTGEPVSKACYRDPTMQAWVDAVVSKHRIRHALVYCSSVAQYVDTTTGARMRRLAHFADVDSQKWRDYSTRHSGPMGWIYRREADRLLDYERAVASRFDVTSFVSGADAALFRQLAPESDQRIEVIENGVDTEYFDPDLEFADPYPTGGPAIVFTGVMDYWANVDAVCWFAQSVLPGVRQGCRDARFYIVGSKPTEAVTKLAQLPGVVVTGRVPDVRPYLRYAAAAVAPLRIARGTQNKVLEALSMAKAVLMTRGAAEGLRDVQWLRRWTSDDADALARMVVDAVRGPKLIPEGRAYVQAHYSWSAKLATLDRLLFA